jgi:predicted unusual protein kinase regulating ubiquinone biosynthesis (AarF/ABC1/UbiB family)
MYTTLYKQISFLCKVIFILLSEYLIYLWYGDYKSLIYHITEKLSAINILYVKVFQAFAYNNTLIDDTINNELIKYTDDAPWDYTDINLKMMVEMANKYNIYLPFRYEVPINSGMIALVFKAIDKDNGKPVVIKMKRTNIQEKLDNAIDNLLFIVYILSFIPIFNSYKLQDVIYKNVEIIKHQTSFLEEIDNMNKMRENCKNLKYVIIPKANRQITEEYPEMIVMNYIEGKKINQISKEYYETYAKLVVKFGMVTSTMHGFSHGDLHSGNILFIRDLKDNKYPHKLGIIDFGIMYNVNEQFKGMLFDLLTQMFDNTPKVSAEKILNSGIIEPRNICNVLPKEDYDNILTIVEEMVKETIFESKKANQIQIYRLISKLKEIFTKKEVKESGIRLSDDFVKCQLVLAMCQGVTLSLCNNDFIPLMDNVINELFNTSFLLNSD